MSQISICMLRICNSASSLSIFWRQRSTYSQPAEMTFCVPDVFVSVFRTSSADPPSYFILYFISAAFGGYLAVQGDGLCFWDVAAVR